MISNYLTIAWRSLLKSRYVTLINLSGLVIGIGGALLIGIFILDELAYDRHFTFHDRIYRLTSTYTNQGTVVHSAQTTANITSLITQFPEVESATRIMQDEGFILSNKQAFKESIFYTDSSLASLFDLTLLAGSKFKCLAHPSSVIISRRMAVKLFGENWMQKKVIGERLAIDGWLPLNITGVFSDLPDHTHIKANLFASIPSGYEKWMDDESEVYTYVLVKHNSNPESLREKLKTSPAFLSKTNQVGLLQVGMQRLTDIHLFSSLENDNAILGNIKNMMALLLVTVFLLVIALANFANLFAASSFHRLKEVGVRKAIGALNSQLRNQFLLETFLIATIASVVSVMLVICFIPTFNELTGSQLAAESLLKPEVVLFVIALLVVVSLAAGLYPSVYLSGTKTIDALKGMKNKKAGVMKWRNGLVIIQFSISCVVIALSIVAYRQVNLINTKPLGFDKENTLALSNPYMLGKIDKILAFKNELLTVPGVAHVSITGYTPSQNRWNRSKITFPGCDPNSTYTQSANWLVVDEGYIPTMGLTLIAGRNFNENHTQDAEAVIINEKAVHLFGLAANGKNPLGAELSFKSGDNTKMATYKVVGVVKDFNFASLHEPVKPFIMEVDYQSAEMALRLSSGRSTKATINLISAVWKKHLSNIPFEYHFIKDRFDELHKSDRVASKTFLLLCFVTILLSALGFYSVVTFTVTNRTKEIAIRKLLGASRTSIVALLTSQFIKLVIISFAMALPLAWLLSNRWLSDFAFRTEISWWIYTVTAFVLFFVAVVSSGYQTLKAASSNPVKNLKYE